MEFSNIFGLFEFLKNTCETRELLKNIHTYSIKFLILRHMQVW